VLSTVTLRKSQVRQNNKEEIQMAVLDIDAISVDFPALMELLTNISPDISVCIRGRHAVGKSESVYQSGQTIFSDLYKDEDFCARMVAAVGGTIKTPNGLVTEWNYDMGVPIVERRLSQMTEGDIIGLPFMNGKNTFDEKGKKTGWASTQFQPCDWLIAAVQFPCIVFLDERNRALEGVKQAVFQLTDSKAFYGNTLHAETRIVIAENDSEEYQVQQCDPAEISRCATVRLDPTVKSWLDYAEGKIDLAIVEFIQKHEECLEHTGVYAPGKKYPDRRSWFKLAAEVERFDLVNEPNSSLLRVLAGSMLGSETANSFTKFLQARDRSVSAKDIIKSWAKAKKRLQNKDGHIAADQFMEVTLKIASMVKGGHMLTLEEAHQYALFVQDSPAESVLQCWAAVQADSKGMLNIHRFLEDVIMAAVQGDEYTNIKIASVAEVRSGKADSNAEATNAAVEEFNEGGTENVKKRGARQ